MPLPPEPFGVALRRLRTRSGLSQEQLAERAGLSPRAIRALELGERERPHPHTIRSLAAAMGLDAEERSNLADAVLRPKRTAPAINGGERASWVTTDAAHIVKAEALLASMPIDVVSAPGALPPGSRMPLSRNPLFIGRGDELLQIAAALRQAGTLVALGQVVASTGLGGLGKTQLAVEFLHRYGRFFAGGVYWLSFASADEVPLQVAACAGPGFEARPMEERVQWVKDAWQSATPRLLVFDHCEEEALLDAWRPPSGGCRVLVTSRRQHWSPTLGVTTLPLDLLPRADSIDLLRCYRPDLPADDPGLDAVASELGDLPLALHLVGSYLRAYHAEVSLGAYLIELRRSDVVQHASLLGTGLDDSVSPTHHVQGVAQTFALCLDRLDREREVDRIALAVLARMACMSPGEPVARDLLAKTLEDVDPLLVADGLRRLAAVGLVEDAGGSLRLHRLLVHFVRQEGLDSTAQPAVDRALIKYGIALGLNDQVGLGEVRPVSTRILAVTDRILAKMTEANQSGSVPWLYGLAAQLHDRGALAAARTLYERGVANGERLFGSSHAYTAQGLNDLALVLHDQGEFMAATPLYERALAIYEQVLGPDHLFSAICLNNLAELHRQRGELRAARSMLVRVLGIYVRELGADHPATIRGNDDLAQVLQDLGEPAVAGTRLAPTESTLRGEPVPNPRKPSTADDLMWLFGFDRSRGLLPSCTPPRSWARPLAGGGREIS